jgi:hypothetical protein
MKVPAWEGREKSNTGKVYDRALNLLQSDCLDEVDCTHTLFGLTIRSNVPIPGLAPLGTFSHAVDLGIHLGVSPYGECAIPASSEELTYVSSYTDETGNPALRIWKTPDGIYLHLVYYDGIEFWLDRRGKTLWAVWPETSTLSDALSYLLGPVLGLLLRLRGVTCLHASSVALEDCSVVFVGREGAGKSTTAAGFARQGYGVISDDVAALAESEVGFQVLPAYPHVCLWPDSVEKLYGSSEALPRLSPGSEKRRLALGDQGTRFENRLLPLGAIYVLGDRRPDPAPYVEAMPLRSALLSLVADTYANKILDRDMRANEFAVLGRLVTTVPIRRIHPHNDASRLEGLCALIREDFASLHNPTSARL